MKRVFIHYNIEQLSPEAKVLEWVLKYKKLIEDKINELIANGEYKKYDGKHIITSAYFGHLFNDDEIDYECEGADPLNGFIGFSEEGEDYIIVQVDICESIVGG